MPTQLSPEMQRRAGGHALRVVFDEATIADRVRELGHEITAAYPEGELLVLGLLKGSFIFLSDLVRQIDRPLHLDFLVASSYGTGTVSSGTVRLLYDPETPLEGARAKADDLGRAVVDLQIAHAGAEAAPVVTISRGIACLLPTSEHGPLELLQRADEMLYVAKRSGRNRTCG